jgi:cell wall-associated NlpC family hydrolase
VSAHRKRKKRPRPFSSSASRTAATLALAGAATAGATASSGTAQAEPRLTQAQLKSRVDTLYQQAGSATQRYNGTKTKVDEARSALSSLRDEAARGTERLNTARGALGAMASAQYRSGGLDPAVQLALSSRPEDFLESAAVAERAGSRNARTVSRVHKELARIDQLHTQADDRLTELRTARKRLERQKAAVQEKLAEAKKLLGRLDAPQRARYEGGREERTARTDPAAGTAAPATQAGTAGPTARAATAVAFARGALGKPYVWGATGPDAFDCSGLTQAAWRAAGVSVPRTTYTQINAGRRVSRSELAPGDLVFFYSGISHVGLYIGHGQMIHAPHPGAAVRVAPIDEMPFAGAVRPA